MTEISRRQLIVGSVTTSCTVCIGLPDDPVFVGAANVATVNSSPNLAIIFRLFEALPGGSIDTESHQDALRMICDAISQPMAV